MDQRPYAIAADPARKLVTMSFDPVFWHKGVSSNFIQDCITAIASLECHSGEHVILVDLRQAVLQGQEVYNQMLGLMSSATARRIALVAAGPLTRMQTKRLQVRDNIVMFGDMAEATDWLFKPDSVTKAA